MWRGETSPLPGTAPQITCFPAHRLSTERKKEKKIVQQSADVF
jgi:hypothetical protein